MVNMQSGGRGRAMRTEILGTMAWTTLTGGLVGGGGGGCCVGCCEQEETRSRGRTDQVK